MPLFLAKTGSPSTVLTKDKDRIVGYMLTPDGAKQLRAAGVRSGGKVPARVLASLIRSGNAHSPRPAESAGQHRFDFADDNTADYLPRCEMTGTTGDVHLVVYGEGNGTVAKLLGPEPRFLLQKVTSLSVPVMILNPTLLGQLEAANKIPPKSTAASTLRGWFRQDLESAWEKLQQEHARRQEMLHLGGITRNRGGTRVPEGAFLSRAFVAASNRACSTKRSAITSVSPARRVGLALASWATVVTPAAFNFFDLSHEDSNGSGFGK